MHTIPITEITCNICKKVIVKASLTNCGHSFCYICLNENWLIEKSNCPMCQSDLKIGSILNNLSLDEFINFEIKSLSIELYNDFQERLNIYKITTNEKK